MSRDETGSPRAGGAQGPPGAGPEDRSFGADGGDVQIFEGQGEDPGATDEVAPPGGEHSGYGDTPPR